MSKYLLDTDICIFFLRGKYDLVDKIENIGKDNCYVSIITIAELRFGAENSQNIEKHLEEVEFFEQNFAVLPVDKALPFYAKEKARLRKIGNPVAEFDLLIASTAIANNLKMVTRNTKHFQRIQQIELEDWTNQ